MSATRRTVVLMSDAYLFDLGFLLFAIWGVIVAIVSVAAFWRDLLPRTRLESTTKKN
jgi:hypothetical protein